ncbi:unnamed protein product, partial [Urochloa humidicola]
EEIPGIVHADICKFRYICGSIRIPAHLEDSINQRYQLGFLLSALGCNLSVFTPMTVEIMIKRHKMEKDLRIRTEVGYSKNTETAKRSPDLAAMMNHKFGMIHGLSSLTNIGSLAMHSWYLSSKLDL